MTAKEKVFVYGQIIIDFTDITESHFDFLTSYAIHRFCFWDYTYFTKNRYRYTHEII